ncbi:uncharacterized protein CMC5_029440 [Chondromyces crocatus]|uniref:Uncharacterized protein n=1 Tax=Chondromyces crocatus TaxID=52 RepID=A0A0K1EDY5_CHOCO|nr:uncharacterized protein CMC5_029440 [Chondromyces crocatus]
MGADCAGGASSAGDRPCLSALCGWSASHATRSPVAQGIPTSTAYERHGRRFASFGRHGRGNSTATKRGTSRRREARRPKRLASRAEILTDPDVRVMVQPLRLHAIGELDYTACAGEPPRASDACRGTSASFQRVLGNLRELPTRVGEPPRASDACRGTSASFQRVSGNLRELPTRVGEPRRASDACQGTSASFRRVSGNLRELPTSASATARWQQEKPIDSSFFERSASGGPRGATGTLAMPWPRQLQQTFTHLVLPIFHLAVLVRLARRLSRIQVRGLRSFPYLRNFTE